MGYPARLVVGAARRNPELELPLERIRLPVAADRVAEEVADLAPPAPEHAACEREAGADVGLPRGACETRRHRELERRDDTAGSHHASELRQCRAGVLDVPEEIRDREVVEGDVSEWKRLRGRLDQLDAVVEPATRAREHLGALIDAGHAEPASRELGCHQPGSRGDVEHVTAVPWEA